MAVRLLQNSYLRFSDLYKANGFTFFDVPDWPDFKQQDDDIRPFPDDHGERRMGFKRAHLPDSVSFRQRDMRFLGDRQYVSLGPSRPQDRHAV